MTNTAWPELNYADWAPTKKTLQMVLQMLGKARLALTPPQPEWLNAALYVDARGFVTGAIPAGERLISMGVDVFDGVLWVSVSDGRSELITLDGRCVAEIWQLFTAALAKLEAEVDIWPKPQELADTTPFAENTHDCTFVAEDAQRFHAALSTVQGVFEEFRSGFFGRSGVQFWWGGFDLAVLLFSGRKVPAPTDRGYIAQYDLDAEHLNAGLWAGDDTAPQPGFYAYVAPRPAGCETASIEPGYASWVEEMGEWLMPYEAVRTCADPRRAILDFLGAAYRVATTLGDWDAEAHEYARPPAPRRG